MKFKNRINWLVALTLAAVALLLTACGGNSGTLIYRAGGAATEAKVVYTDAEGNTQTETVALPWETRVEVNQDFKFEFRVSNTQPAGKVKCEVQLNDDKLGEKDSAAYAVCRGSVHIKGRNINSNFASHAAEGDLKDVVSLIDQGHTENAMSKLEAILNEAPNFANAYFTQGLGYEDMKELDQALSAYSQAIKLNPKYAKAYFNRGNIYGKQGNYKQAIADYNQAIALNSDFGLAYLSRGNAHTRLKEFEPAIDDFTTVIKLEPKRIDGYLERGVAYAKTGAFEQAIPDFTAVIELKPDYDKGYYNRAIAYANTGEPEAAKSDLLKAKELTDDPDLLALINEGLTQLNDAN